MPLVVAASAAAVAISAGFNSAKSINTVGIEFDRIEMQMSGKYDLRGTFSTFAGTNWLKIECETDFLSDLQSSMDEHLHRADILITVCMCGGISIANCMHTSHGALLH